MATSSTSSLSHPTLNFSISYYQLQPLLCHHHQHRRHLKNPTTKPISLSFSPRPRRRRRRPRHPFKRNEDSSHPHPQSFSSDSNKLHFILDVDQLKTRTPLGLLESKFHQFLSSGIDAYDDIRSLIIVKPGSNRIVVSCSDSTVRFVGGVAIWGFVGVVLIRFLGKLGLGFSGRSGNGGVEVVKRRDRKEVGGKEVVVERRVVKRGDRVSEVGMNERGLEVMPGNSTQKEVKKLPDWWPVLSPKPVVEANREAYRREANKLVQAITDDKLRGKDVSEEDILELRRICRMSGTQLSFGTENARDSFYRLAVYNVINTCCRVGNPSVKIDGEDVRLFTAGLACDVGLSNPRAATIVSAAVAAQTRLWFLQAWALEMQAKHTEAMEELRKICLIHQIFPPEPSSPEMEMVARGLQKNLKLEQREFLLTNLISVCGEQSRRTAAESLGLV